MNLEHLKKWVDSNESKEVLKKLVKKDPKGEPSENDIMTAASLLKEIKKRIELINDHTKKAARYETDVIEYLNELARRNIKYIPQPIQDERQFNMGNTDNAVT